jgi:hypothetical protein
MEKTPEMYRAVRFNDDLHFLEKCLKTIHLRINMPLLERFNGVIGTIARKFDSTSKREVTSLLHVDA